MKRILNLFFWIYTSFIIILSVIPFFDGYGFNRVNLEIGGLGVRMDHFLHMLMYFSFYVIFWILYRFEIIIFKTNPVSKYFFFTLSLAFATELIQIFITGRSFYLPDLGANLAGIFFGVIAVRFTNGITKKIESDSIIQDKAKLR